MPLRVHSWCWLAGLVYLSAMADPVVIAHRGASGYLPEHTLEAYALAYAMGADYIEPDLVMTKDEHLIAMHDLQLESTTDVEEQFPERKHEDGHWYAGDFTLEEIKRLRVHERLNNRFPMGKSVFEVPTFEEVIELVQGLNATLGRDVGIYPELKQPSWHREHELPFEETALEVLTRYGYTGADANCFVQCFEPDALRRLREAHGSKLPFIQLVSTRAEQAELLTEAGLADVAQYANGIGPDKRLVEKNPQVVKWAHALGLKVHVYTLRKDDVMAKYADFAEEVRQFYMTYEVDGAFTDHPDAVREALTTTQ